MKLLYECTFFTNEKNFFLSIHLTNNLFFKSRHFVRLIKSHKKNTPGKRRVNQNKTHRKGEK